MCVCVCVCETRGGGGAGGCTFIVSAVISPQIRCFFFQKKILIFFLSLHKNICCGTHYIYVFVEK